MSSINEGVRWNQCKRLPVSEGYSPIHPKKHIAACSILLLTKTVWIYLSTPHHYNQVQEEGKFTQQEAPWPDLLLLYRHHFWAFAEPGKNWMKPRRDHHELFFCVKSPTDNPCIESEAWRNNKVSVYQTHWSPHSTYKQRPATSLTKHLSERCHSGCVNVGKLRTSTSLAYILQ